MSCDSFELFKRWFLVVSNFFFPLISVYAITLTVQNKTLRWFDLTPEIILPIITCIVSALYHRCDDSAYCSAYCITDWIILYKLDFIFAYQMIPLAAAYAVEHRFTPYKIIFHILTFLANIIFVNTYQQSGQFDGQWYGILVGCVLFFTLIRFIWLYCTNSLTEEMKDHFDWRAGIIALTCAIIGFVFKWLPTNDGQYWWMHSLWHIFIAFAIFFEFNMYDFTALLCCKKNQTTTILPTTINQN